MQPKLFLLLLLLYFTSCRRTIEIAGVVADKSSHQPLDSVAVTCLDEIHSNGYEWISTYTSPNGKFLLNYPLREMSEKGKLPYIFQKNGYGTTTVFFPGEGPSDTIFLERSF